MGINQFGAGILVKPDKHPQVLFRLNQGRGMICDVYVSSADADSRLGWENVIFSICEYNGFVYYVIKTKEDAGAKTSDRRRFKRYVVDRHGTLSESGMPEDVIVQVHDISDGGVSFFGQKNLQIYQRDVRLVFDDTIMDQNFHIDVRCNCVRVVDAEIGLLFGCKIVEEYTDVKQYIEARKAYSR
jgi:hypothetical protein